MNIVITSFFICYKPLWGRGPHVTGLIIILPLWLTFDKFASRRCMTLTQFSFSMSRLIHQLLTHSTPLPPPPSLTHSTLKLSVNFSTNYSPYAFSQSSVFSSWSPFLPFIRPQAKLLFKMADKTQNKNRVFLRELGSTTQFRDVKFTVQEVLSVIQSYLFPKYRSPSQKSHKEKTVHPAENILSKSRQVIRGTITVCSAQSVRVILIGSIKIIQSEDHHL